MNRTKIWVVSSGEYSDYSVSNAFEREEDAHAAVAAGYGEEVEERVLFPAGDLPVKTIRWHGWASLYPDGTVMSPRVRPNHAWADDIKPRGSRPVVTVTEMPHEVRISVEGASEKAVMKATSDRLAKLRAERLEPAATDNV